MRLAALTGSVSRLAGGTFTSIRRPLQEMARQFPMTVGVFGVRDRFSEEDAAKWSPLTPTSYNAFGPRAFGWTPGMLEAVKAFRPELIQVHGIWMHYSVVSSMLHRRQGIPCVVHLHGMLDEWAVGRSRWKKQVSAWLYEKDHLRGASCLRALNEGEVRAIRAFGLKDVRLCRIPNGIDVPADASAGPAPWGGEVEPGKKVLLFLSRIHPKKGIANLLMAWSKLQADDPPASDWELVVAGWDTTGHEAELRRLARELRLERSVKFVGPLFDEAKDRALRNAAAFVLPSFSEGLPMTVLEAWAYSLPVVITPHCNLPEGLTARAAIQVDPEARSIESGLRELVHMADAERIAMGTRGKDLVCQKYRWDAIARQMHAVNAWVLGGGVPPECVL